jgi:hypothetical protein
MPILTTEKSEITTVSQIAQFHKPLPINITKIEKPTFPWT